MKFPKITGSIKHVEPQHYDDLIGLYVDQVKKLDRVLGVVLFGSVSTPGLSDIDLVVTVPDNGPWPAWEDISLKQIALGHPAESVVAHDIFVWPKSVAENAESFFYIDQQTVLHGSKLGGNLDPKLNGSFKELLSMDYIIHRFDGLSSLLTRPFVDVRSILLFISTLRHTCHLAEDLGLISKATSKQTTTDIANLRATIIDAEVTADLFDGWPDRIISLLWTVTIALSKRMGIDQQAVTVPKWRSSARQIFLNSQSQDGVAEWENCFRQLSRRWTSKYVRATPIPASVFQHVQRYNINDSNSGRYLKEHYPGIFRTGDRSTPLRARELRVDSVIKHWQFLSRSGFSSSSGKGYIGLSMPPRNSLKTKALRTLASINAIGLPIQKYRWHRGN